MKQFVADTAMTLLFSLAKVSAIPLMIVGGLVATGQIDQAVDAFVNLSNFVEMMKEIH